MSSVAGAVAAAVSRGASRGWLRRTVGVIAREPFFQFIVLGALLFAASEYLESRAKFTRIVVTRAQVDGIENNYRLQYGASPTAEQSQALVAQFVNEEIFYHEALRLKLDEDDEIVRRRMVQKYEFLQLDLATPVEPTDAELRAFYQAHAATYETPERTTFTQVFFDATGDGEAAHQRALRALTVLRQQRPERAPSVGDSFPGAIDYSAATPTQVRRAFGSNAPDEPGAFSDAVFASTPGSWSGPFRSGYGWHLVYVTSREVARVTPYAQIRDQVRRDFLEAARAARNAASLDTLREKYTIVRE